MAFWLLIALQIGPQVVSVAIQFIRINVLYLLKWNPKINNLGISQGTW